MNGNLAWSWQVLLAGPFVADQILGATNDTKGSPASDQAGKDGSHRLPELAWSPVQTVCWRDGHEHAAQYAWFRHQPVGGESPRRFAVVRPRPDGEMFWR